MKKVAGFIQRKSMLYQTGVEYGDYTMNHVLGCAHGCKFPCYAFLQKKRFGQVKDYNEWCKPYLVSNTIQLLEEEIPKLRNKIESVQLCFTTDPFMYEYEEITQVSLQAIRLLNDNGIKCTVLTKGLLPFELADRTRYSADNEYGITLISVNENYRIKMEPGAAPYFQRLEAMKRLSEAGCRTWVSMEPYPTPNLIDQSLQELLSQVSFTNKIIFGRTNYSSKVTKGYPDHRQFYNVKSHEVIDFCKEHKIEYYIKQKTMTKE